MNKEEKKAIESLTIIKDYIGDNYSFSMQGIRNLKEQLKIVLNLIEKQEKVIDEMAKYIDENNYVDAEECDFQEKNNIKCVESKDCKDCIKQYFYNF